MTQNSRFRFYLAGQPDPICPSDEIWQAPLPSNRHHFDETVSRPTNSGATYGAYFNAVADFLGWQCCGRLREAVGRRRKSDPEHLDLLENRVFLEKHGAYYHPARIETVGADCRESFVLNVAVSPAGAGAIQREFSLLAELSRSFPNGYLPTVYSLGEGGNGACRWQMFLGEWFEGFCEFHLTRRPDNGDLGILVWDARTGAFFLSKDQTRQLYRQVALILTSYFDLQTTQQIFPWHHAAGDFVVHCLKGRLTVRLITARQFPPIVRDPQGVAESLPEILFFFLANLSIQTRLDRLEGVGDLVWSDPVAVGETLKGFLMGLEQKHPALPGHFVDYLSAFSIEEVVEFFQAVLKTFDPRAPEILLVSENLNAHARLMFHEVQKRASVVSNTT